MNKSIIRGFFLTAAIASITFLVFFYEKQTTINSYTTKPPQEYMKNVSVIHFNEQGKIKDRLYADYWAYLSENKLSQLIEPKLILHKDDNTVWTVKAKYGHAYHKTIDSKVSLLKLWDEVNVQRPEIDKKSTIIELNTNKIEYNPKTSKVTTDQFVTLTKPGLLITGTGLKGNLNKNYVELLNDVKTKLTS